MAKVRGELLFNLLRSMLVSEFSTHVNAMLVHLAATANPT